MARAQPKDIRKDSPLIQDIRNLGEIRSSGISNLVPHSREEGEKFLFIERKVYASQANLRTNHYIGIDNDTVIVSYDPDLELFLENRTAARASILLSKIDLKDSDPASEEIKTKNP